jgi:indolepyruvate decarboxylase
MVVVLPPHAPLRTRCPVQPAPASASSAVRGDLRHRQSDGTWDRFLGAFAQVTAGQARLTPYNAATEIDRLIMTAWREKLPVYLELPSDIAYLDIEVPAEPLMMAQPASDAERLRSCASAIAGRLAGARSPAILVDQDAARYGAATEIMGLAEKMQLPVAVAGPAKAVIDETFPYYAGIYNGGGSPPPTREAIENADCLLSIGYRPIDGTSGDFTASLPHETIVARGHSVDVDGDNYQAVNLKEVLRGVINQVPQVTSRQAPQPAVGMPPRAQGNGSAQLTQAASRPGRSWSGPWPTWRRRWPRPTTPWCSSSR